MQLEKKNKRNTILIASFIPKEMLSWFLSYLEEKFMINNRDVFVYEIEDDETKEKEKVKAEIAVIYNYITNTVEDIDSWLNFKNSDKYKDAAIYNNVLVD